MQCSKCGSDNVEMISAPCAVAVQAFKQEDYFGDGSKFVRTGVHFEEYKCQACGDIDGDVCIHD